MKTYLVENGFLGTDETPLVHLLESIREGDRETDMEDLEINRKIKRYV